MLHRKVNVGSRTLGILWNRVGQCRWQERQAMLSLTDQWSSLGSWHRGNILQVSFLGDPPTLSAASVPAHKSEASAEMEKEDTNHEHSHQSYRSIPTSLNADNSQTFFPLPLFSMIYSRQQFFLKLLLKDFLTSKRLLRILKIQEDWRSWRTNLWRVFECWRALLLCLSKSSLSLKSFDSVSASSAAPAVAGPDQASRGLQQPEPLLEMVELSGELEPGESALEWPDPTPKTVMNMDQ